MTGPGAKRNNQTLIRVALNAGIWQGINLCVGSLGITRPDFQLVVKPVLIGAQARIAAEAFVGAGLTAGENAILGARERAFGDLISWIIYAEKVRKHHQGLTHCALAEK